MVTGYKDVTFCSGGSTIARSCRTYLNSDTAVTIYGGFGDGRAVATSPPTHHDGPLDGGPLVA